MVESAREAAAVKLGPLVTPEKLRVAPLPVKDWRNVEPATERVAPGWRETGALTSTPVRAEVAVPGDGRTLRGEWSGVVTEPLVMVPPGPRTRLAADVRARVEVVLVSEPPMTM